MLMDDTSLPLWDLTLTTCNMTCAAASKGYLAVMLLSRGWHVLARIKAFYRGPAYPLPTSRLGLDPFHLPAAAGEKAQLLRKGFHPQDPSVWGFILGISSLCFSPRRPSGRWTPDPTRFGLEGNPQAEARGGESIENSCFFLVLCWLVSCLSEATRLGSQGKGHLLVL